MIVFLKTKFKIIYIENYGLKPVVLVSKVLHNNCDLDWICCVFWQYLLTILVLLKEGYYPPKML